jgi:hypothetical protein
MNLQPPSKNQPSVHFAEGIAHQSGYLAAFLICWSPPLLTAFFYKVGLPQVSMITAWGGCIFPTLQGTIYENQSPKGFFNFIIFGLNPRVRRKYYILFMTKCCGWSDDKLARPLLSVQEKLTQNETQESLVY